MGPSTLAETMGPLLQPPVICQVGAIPLLYPILEELGLQTEVNVLCPSKADVDLGRLYPMIGEIWSRLVSRAGLQEQIDLRAVHWDTTSFLHVISSASEKSWSLPEIFGDGEEDSSLRSE